MIKVQAKGEKKAEILIYDVIGADFFGEGVTAKKVKTDLDALGEVTDITVRINSPGGNVWDGLAIYNLLKEHEAQVHVQIDALAASAASLIAMAGDLITMNEGSLMMIHNPMTFAFGDADDMRKTGEVLDKIEGQFVDVYARRTGGKAAEIDALMAAETWFSAADAIKAGFADEKADDDDEQELAAAASSEYEAGLTSLQWQKVVAFFKNAPKSLKPAAPVLNAAALAVATLSGVPDATPQEEASMSANAPASVQAADIKKAADEAATVASQRTLEDESKRRAAVKNVFRAFGDKYRDLRDTCLDDVKCSVDMASQKLLEELGKGQQSVGGDGSVVSIEDARDKFRKGATAALAVKAGLEKPDAGNEYLGMTLSDIAGRCLEYAGVSTRGMSPDAKARKVLAMASSDFPQLLSSTAGKVLRTAYSGIEMTWKRWAAKGSVSDFKIHPRIQMGSFNNLATIPEGGEYTYGSISEEYENAQALTKGKALKLTRQMIVNDDLGGFNRRAGMMGRAAARTVNADAYALLMSGSGNNGPTSSDGGQFFNATAATTAGGHANLTSSGTAVSTASIALGRKTMRVQQDKGLKDYLNIMPKVLLAPVGKEDIIWAVINSATDVSQSNPSKRNYAADVARVELITDPALDAISATAWYMFADPMDIAAFEVVFLDGNEEPFVDDDVDWETDALLFKVRLDYGVAPGDWRAAYRNAGA